MSFTNSSENTENWLHYLDALVGLCTFFLPLSKETKAPLVGQKFIKFIMTLDNPGVLG